MSPKYQFKLWRQAIFTVVFIFCGPLLAADSTNSTAGSVNDDNAAQRIDQWNELRFGMLVHWGLYSEWGCQYPGTNGQMLDGESEQMMRHLKIPLAKYKQIADIFNPTNFNADEWVKTAKAAGMKYFIITAKHHDGFAMYDSQCNSYNIVKLSSWHRDPLKELADACQKQGLKFGIYYSLGRDWEDPDVGTKGGYRSNFWDYTNETSKVFSRYFERKVMPQLTELLTHYGCISVVWFDTPEEISMAESQKIVALIHKLQPTAVINTRVGHHLGDFESLEHQVPDNAMDHLWETCLPLNSHWAYFKGDNDWKPVKSLIRDLVDITSKGGNCLLGVGPTGDGAIPLGARDSLNEIGAWLKINGESIYGTTTEPIDNQPDWGRIIKRDDKFYVHIFDWPLDGKLALPNTITHAKSAYFLADKHRAPIKIQENSREFTLMNLPVQSIESEDTVVVIE